MDKKQLLQKIASAGNKAVDTYSNVVEKPTSDLASRISSFIVETTAPRGKFTEQARQQYIETAQPLLQTGLEMAAPDPIGVIGKGVKALRAAKKAGAAVDIIKGAKAPIKKDYNDAFKIIKGEKPAPVPVQVIKGEKAVPEPVQVIKGSKPMPEPVQVVKGGPSQIPKGRPDVEIGKQFGNIGSNRNTLIFTGESSKTHRAGDAPASAESMKQLMKAIQENKNFKPNEKTAPIIEKLRAMATSKIKNPGD